VGSLRWELCFFEHEMRGESVVNTWFLCGVLLVVAVGLVSVCLEQSEVAVNLREGIPQGLKPHALLSATARLKPYP
jgi:hypothetical protein